MDTILQTRGILNSTKPKILENGITVTLDKNSGAPLKTRMIVGNEEDRQRRLELIKQEHPDAVGLFEKKSYRDWAKANNVSEDNFIFTIKDADGNEKQVLYNNEGLVPDLGDLGSIGRDIVSTIAYPVGALAGAPTAIATGGASVLVGGALAAEGAGQAYDRLIDILSKEYVSRGSLTKNTVDALTRIGIDITGSKIFDDVARVAKNLSVRDTVKKVFGVTDTKATQSKEILEKAKKLGIEVPTLGQVVDSKFIQALEKRIAMKPMAVGPYAEMMKKYQDQMAKALVDLSEKYGKPVGSGEEIAILIHKQAQQTIEKTDAKINNLYNLASKALPTNARSNLRNVRELYEKLVDEQEKTVDKARGLVIGEIKNILNLSDKAVGRKGPIQQGYTAQNLLDQRSIVLRDIRQGDSALKGDFTKAKVPYLKELQTALFNDTEELVTEFGDEGAFKLLRDAQNFRATAQEEIFDTTNLIIDRYDKKAINVFNFALDGTKTGSERIKKIYDDILDDKGRQDLTASLTRRMGFKKPDGGEGSVWSISTFLKNYNDYSKDAKNVIFGNTELRKNLDTIVEIANRSMDVEQFANPSKTGFESSSLMLPILSTMVGGTAYMQGASASSAALAAGGIYMTPRAALTLITSPKFTSWLLQTSKKADKNPNILAQSIGNLAASVAEKEVDPAYGEAVDEFINTLLFQGQPEEMSQTETKDVQTMAQADVPKETPQQTIGNIQPSRPNINIQPPTRTTEQPVQPASLPITPNTKGIASLNKGEQFGGLFPQDNLGQLIANRKA